jgi:L-alanine-DL-glutamate epimerase-like enolase superfamily enzyme
VADYAVAKRVTFVNHTFTSHLALSASLQPFAGLADHRICEFPFKPKPLSLDMMAVSLPRDAAGEIMAPNAPGLGVAMNVEGMRPYLQDVEIKVAGKLLYATPPLN